MTEDSPYDKELGERWKPIVESLRESMAYAAPEMVNTHVSTAIVRLHESTIEYIEELTERLLAQATR